MNTARMPGGLSFALLMVTSVACTPALAQMKAGLWESRIIKQTVNGEDMSAKMNDAQAQMREAMAKMPPEQRKKMEEMMGKQGVQLGGSGAARMCISAEMAARQEPVPDVEGRCKNEKFTKSGNAIDFEFTCNTPDGPQRGKGRTTFSGDTMRSEMSMSGQRNGRPTTMVMASEARYLGANCGGLKPIDEITQK